MSASNCQWTGIVLSTGRSRQYRVDSVVPNHIAHRLPYSYTSRVNDPSPVSFQCVGGAGGFGNKLHLVNCVILTALI
jgi:hypothetical protein